MKNKITYLLNHYLSGESIDYRQVFAIIVPILVDQAFLVCLNMLNTAMISSSGVTAVSAVNMVDSLNIFLLNVFIAVSTGGTVVVAQYKGNGDDRMVSRSAAGALTAVFLLASVLAGGIILFRNPLLALLFGNAEPAVFDNARLYLIGSCISYPCFGIFEAVCGSLRGVADTKSSLLLSLITNISYVLFNLLFINTLQMGVLGMVISMNVARFLGMACSIIYMVRFNHTVNVNFKDIFHIDFKVLKRMFSVGLPFAAEQMFFNGGKLLTQTFIVQLGTLSLTVNAICGSIASFIQIGAGAISLSAITVVGQCMGRKNVADARKFVRSFIVLGSLAMVVGDLITLPLLPVIIPFFSPPPEIVPTITTIMLMTGCVQPFLWPISFILPSSLRASGDSKFTSTVSLLSMWLFRVVMGYVFGIVLGWGIIGVWAAMCAEWGVRGLIFLLRFRGNKWHDHNLIGEGKIH